jgi:hypothetical protein
MMNRTIVRIVLVVAVVAMLLGPSAGAQGDNSAAQAAAESWVALIDQGQYAASWQNTAASFKGAVPQPQWEQAVGAARGPFGGLKSRSAADSGPVHRRAAAADLASLARQHADPQRVNRCRGGS